MCQLPGPTAYSIPHPSTHTHRSHTHTQFYRQLSLFQRLRTEAKLGVISHVPTPSVTQSLSHPFGTPAPSPIPREPSVWP